MGACREEVTSLAGDGGWDRDGGSLPSRPFSPLQRKTTRCDCFDPMREEKERAETLARSLLCRRVCCGPVRRLHVETFKEFGLQHQTLADPWGRSRKQPWNSDALAMGLNRLCCAPQVGGPVRELST
jgi:hypothetical protein